MAEQLDDGSMDGGGLDSSSVDSSNQMQGFTQGMLMQGLNNPPPQPQQPSAGVQATRKHGGLLTGLVGVLLDGLSAGVRTPQGPQGFSQSAQMAAQMPMQRQQQQMAFNTQQELQRAQIAQAHVQQAQTRLMLAKANDDFVSGMSGAALKFANAAMDEGRAQQMGEGSREAAFDKAKQLQDQNKDSALHIWVYPTHHDENGQPDTFGVFEAYPSGTYQKDFKTVLPGNKSRGGQIDDLPFTIKAGTENQQGTMLFSEAGRNQTAMVTHDDERLAKLQEQSIKDISSEKQTNVKAGATIEAAKIRAAASNSPQTVDSQARMLVEGDLDPSQVSKSRAAQGPILAAADKYSQQKYGKPYDAAQQQADYKYATSTKTQDTLKYLGSLTGPDNKSGNLGALLKISDSITRTDFPKLNDAAAWARFETGDPAIAKYHTAVTEVADQVAKILQGGGSGTSDAKLKQAQEMFNTGFSKDQMKAVASTLLDLLANRKRELIGDNIYLKKQYGRQAATADRDAKKIALTDLPAAQ